MVEHAVKPSVKAEMTMCGMRNFMGVSLSWYVVSGGFIGVLYWTKGCVWVGMLPDARAKNLSAPRSRKAYQ